MKEIEILKRLGACEGALKWLKTQESPQQAWQDCQRGDWMLWLLRRTEDLRNNEAQLRSFTLAKARCARLVVHLMQDERSKKAVEVAEDFGNGKATMRELSNAASDASNASNAAAASVASAASASAHAASDAASDAAYAAAAASDAASDAAHAAYAAAYAAASAAAAAAAVASAAYAASAASAADASVSTGAVVSAAAVIRSNILLQCANIVRCIYPNPPELSKSI